MAADSDKWPLPSVDDKTFGNGYCCRFCIIEGPETVEDFAKMELQEIQDNIRSRRNKIFLHMEETAANLKVYYATCFSLISGIIIFGGLLAPTLELKLGLGGTTYADFIRSMHLPMQLSQVDPIVASFSGGAVGVISALMVVEVNNVKQQEHKRCKYCIGTGYLACARCANTGAIVLSEQVSTVNGGEDKRRPPPNTERCPNCSGSGKVMCPTCLCTGMAMASEHDPRIDPFD
ncbi:Protein ORANGE, chloroplastic [Linum perenne]